MEIITLGFLSVLTSLIAGVVGMGGGLMLIAILPSFLPIHALIPIHGFTQMFSNVSRAYFGYKHIQFEVVPKFLIGSIIGVSIIAFILDMISFEYIPLFIGFYILLSLWSKSFNESIKKYENYYLIGFLQSGLSVVVGATGPLTTTLLLKDYEDKDKVVSTAALLMSITHSMKVFVFIYFGFKFSEYIDIILVMVIGVIVGSYLGTKLRNKINGKRLVFIIKLLLSLLAIKLIIGFIVSIF
ncbi:TSUP family transporter [Arcobacteraceae bacterium]|nr:TSUP family transporter [Arcobacteraceae bacterium]